MSFIDFLIDNYSLIAGSFLLISGIIYLSSPLFIIVGPHDRAGSYSTGVIIGIILISTSIFFFRDYEKNQNNSKK